MFVMSPSPVRGESIVHSEPITVRGEPVEPLSLLPRFAQAIPNFVRTSFGGPSYVVSGTLPTYPMSFIPTGVV
jgi:hypothetical protein